MAIDKRIFLKMHAFYRRERLGMAFFLLAFLLSACSSEEPPVLLADREATNEDTSVFVDVLANDLKAKTIDRVTVPRHGSVSLVNGGISYVPNKDFFGLDGFSYQVKKVSAWVDIEVLPINDAPTATADIAYFPASELGVSAMTTQRLNLFVNDLDPEGDSLELVFVSAPRYGSLKIADRALGQVHYTAFDAGAVVDHFEYVMRDMHGAESTAEVIIAVGVAADTPLAFADTAVLLQGESVIIDLLQNDIVTASLVTLTKEARVLEVEILDDGKALVTAPQDFLGSDEFAYSLQHPDGGDVTSARVSLTVYSDKPSAQTAQIPPQLLLPSLGLSARQLAVVVNADDPQSAEYAVEYMALRNIPEDNLLTVSLGVKSQVSRQVFDLQMEAVRRQLPAQVRGYALMFTTPYRVDCMSTTTAFAVGGFDESYCNVSGHTCGSTAISRYYDLNTATALHMTHLRPAMMVAGENGDEVRALMRRGALADGSFPTGQAYFVRTTDSARSTRWSQFKNTAKDWNNAGALLSQYVDAVNGSASNTLRGVDDVLFYLTGLTHVDDLDTLVFHPGAVADHLTSVGGQLTSKDGQMSILRWLEAGATASYGTVVEPCNYADKFPRSDILLDHYYRGNTVLEAYWKSVKRPGEGVFVGEPLARPWGRQMLRYEEGVITLRTTELEPGRRYTVTAADYLAGDFEFVSEIKIDHWGITDIVIENTHRNFYRLQ